MFTCVFITRLPSCSFIASVEVISLISPDFSTAHPPFPVVKSQFLSASQHIHCHLYTWAPIYDTLRLEVLFCTTLLASEVNVQTAPEAGNKPSVFVFIKKLSPEESLSRHLFLNQTSLSAKVKRSGRNVPSIWVIAVFNPLWLLLIPFMLLPGNKHTLTWVTPLLINEVRTFGARILPAWPGHSKKSLTLNYMFNDKKSNYNNWHLNWHHSLLSSFHNEIH